MRVAGTRTLRRVVLAAVVLVSGVASCGPAPDPDPTVGVPQRVSRWTGWMPAAAGEPVAATVVGDAVVVLGSQAGVAVFDRGAGVLRWQYQAPRDTLRKVRVARDGVVFLFDRLVQVRDLRTGALRRELTQVRTAAVSWTTLYVGHWCAGGDCGLAAVDIATGQQRWRLDVPVSQVAAETGEALWEQRTPAPRWESLRAPEPAVLLARGPPGGVDDVIALDAATGGQLSPRSLPAPADPAVRVAVVSPQTYLQWVHSGQCRVSVTGYDLRRGGQVWTAEFGAWEWVSPEPRCGGWRPEVVAGGLLAATANGRPRLVDADTGQVRWTGEPTARQVSAADGLVIVRADNGVGNLIAFDAATGERRWSGRVPKGAAGARKRLAYATAGGGHLTYQTEYDGGGTAENLLWLRNLATGHVDWVARDAGKPVGIGTDWLITSGGAVTSSPRPASHPSSSPEAYPIRLFSP